MGCVDVWMCGSVEVWRCGLSTEAVDLEWIWDGGQRIWWLVVLVVG